MNAKTTSAERAIATGPACSCWRAVVRRIWPAKLKMANRTISQRSWPQAGRQSSFIAQVVIKVWRMAKAPNDDIITEKWSPFLVEKMKRFVV